MSAAYKAADLASRIGASLLGDPDLEITGIGPLDRAGPHDVSYYTDTRFADRLATSVAGAVIVDDPKRAPQKVQFVADQPSLALRGALLAFHRLVPEVVPGIHASSIVHESASVDPTAQIGPLVVIEAGTTVGAHSCVSSGCVIGANSSIGAHCYLYPGATMYGNVRLGDRVIVHSGVVLGADGYGYEASDEGALKVPQIGGVRIDDDVELGANTTIDRGTLGDTIIGKGTKIDNLVMIGHNVEVGMHCLLVSQVGIAGSTHIGNGVILAGQVGVADHLDIGDGATVAAQSGIAQNLEENKTYMGSPAREFKDQARIIASITRLPKWARRLKKLESAINAE